MAFKKTQSTSFNPATIQVNRGQGLRELGASIGQLGSANSSGVNNFINNRLNEMESKEKKLGKKLGQTVDIIYEDREFTDELGNKRTHKVAASYKRPDELLKTSWAASEFDEYAADRYVNQLAINAKQILSDEKLLADERANTDITVAEHIAMYNKNIREPISALLDTVPKEFKPLVEDNFNKQINQTEDLLATQHLKRRRAFKNAEIQNINGNWDKLSFTLAMSNSKEYNKQLGIVVEKNKQAALQNDPDARFFIKNELPTYQLLAQTSESLQKYLNYKDNDIKDVARVAENINKLRIGINMPGQTISLIDAKGNVETVDAKSLGFTDVINSVDIGKIDTELRTQSSILSNYVSAVNTTNKNLTLIDESLQFGAATDYTKKEYEGLSIAIQDLDSNESQKLINAYNNSFDTPQKYTEKNIESDLELQNRYYQFVANKTGVLPYAMSRRLSQKVDALLTTTPSPKSISDILGSTEFAFATSAIGKSNDGDITAYKMIDNILTEPQLEELNVLLHFQDIYGNGAVEEYTKDKILRNNKDYQEKNNKTISDEYQKSSGSSLTLDKKIFEDITNEFSDVLGFTDNVLTNNIITTVQKEVFRKLKITTGLSYNSNLSINIFKRMLGTGQYGKSSLMTTPGYAIDANAGDYNPGSDNIYSKFPIEYYMKKSSAKIKHENHMRENYNDSSNIYNEVYDEIQKDIVDKVKQYKTTYNEFEIEDDLVLGDNVFFNLVNAGNITRREQSVYMLMYYPGGNPANDMRYVMDDNGQYVTYTHSILQNLLDKTVSKFDYDNMIKNPDKEPYFVRPKLPHETYKEKESYGAPKGYKIVSPGPQTFKRKRNE